MNIKNFIEILCHGLPQKHMYELISDLSAITIGKEKHWLRLAFIFWFIFIIIFKVIKSVTN